MAKKKNLIIKVKKNGIEIVYFSGSIYSNLFVQTKEGEEISFENLKEVMKKNKIPNIPCHIVLNEDNEYLLYFVNKFPVFPDDQLRKIIEFEAKRFFNSDVLVDYRILGKITEGPSQNFIVLFVSILKDVLNELMEKFKQVKIKPISITFSFDVTSLIFRKILPPMETYLIINFDHYCTNFIFLKENNILYARRELIGSDNFETLLAREMEISKEKAKEMIEQGLPFSSAKKEFYYIRPVLEQLLKEINNSIQLFQTFYPKEVIKKIYFIGKGMKIKGLLENIQKELLNINCEIPIFEIDTGPIPLDAMDTYGLNFYSPIFNFLLQKKMKLDIDKKFLVIFGIILLYIFSLQIIDQYFWKKLNSIRRKTFSSIPQYEQILQQKISISELLLAVGALIPNDIVLTSITFENEKVIISGNSTEEKPLSDFYISLTKTEFFKNLEMEKLKKEENISFTFKGVLKEWKE